jgi:diguanylate cyclase (GGDEF)-like protein
MTANASNKRAGGIPRLLDRLIRLRPAHAWMLSLLCLDLAVMGDLVTGPDLWFGPFYLFVICLATWGLGWVAGESVALASMALTFAINGITLYPYGPEAVVGNAIMRLLGASMAIAIIAGARWAYLREWLLARTDAMTGALNRQAFFELGGTLAGTCCWRVLLYADLDGLKTINDREGHAAGDACLKAYASHVRRIIRRDDMFARVGGDEFLLFMAVKDEASARSVAARLHASMNAVRGARGQHLRCSVGTIVVPPGRLSIDELVRRADNLMYQAKLRGAALEIAVASDVTLPLTQTRARRTPGAALEPAAPIRKRSIDRRASRS